MGLYATLLPVLQSMAGATRSLGQLEPKDSAGRRLPARAYLPTYGYLLREMQAGHDLLPDVAAFIAEVRPHWAALRADPILARIDALTDHNAEMRDGEVRGEILRVPSGLKESFGDRDFQLKLKQSVPGSNGRTVPVRELVDTVTAPGDALLAEVCATQRATLGVVHALRTFDDTCIRYLAALQVASDTGTPLSRVLALYRIEGNLCVYPSLASLLLGMPSGVLTGGSGAWNDTRIAAVDAKVQGTLIHLTLRPNLEHLVWMADDNHIAMRGVDLPNQRDEHVKSLALASGFLAHTIGGDKLAGRAPGREHNALTFEPNEFRHTSAAYWRASEPTSSEAQALARWQAMLANLAIDRRARLDGGQGPQVVIVAPIDPLQHVVRVLTEGVRLLRYFDPLQTLVYQDGAAGSVTGQVPLAIAYLRYNQQHNSDDSGTAGYLLATLLSVWRYPSYERAPRMAWPLIEAIVATPGLADFLEFTGNQMKAQVAAVRRADEESAARIRRLTGLDSDIVSPAAGIHRAAAVADSLESPQGERLKPVLHSFMTAPGRADIVWTYIQTVSTGHWSSWLPSRQNSTSHRRLCDFYRIAFE